MNSGAGINIYDYEFVDSPSNRNSRISGITRIDFFVSLNVIAKIISYHHTKTADNRQDDQGMLRFGSLTDAESRDESISSLRKMPILPVTLTVF